MPCCAKLGASVKGPSKKDRNPQCGLLSLSPLTDTPNIAAAGMASLPSWVQGFFDGICLGAVPVASARVRAKGRDRGRLGDRTSRDSAGVLTCFLARPVESAILRLPRLRDPPGDSLSLGTLLF